ncbi:MAG TPA: hypothetical protein DCM08_01955 [Microscillaceae bacterium]|jgi:predicted transposase/invertase (TIGR01784 family)|nr:hypothetical protein [Microscillaceae bacterium]
MEYERNLKEARDMYSALLTAKKEGLKEGEKIKSLQVAIKAIKKGFDNKTIQELTGLPIAEIEQLRKGL